MAKENKTNGSAKAKAEPLPQVNSGENSVAQTATALNDRKDAALINPELLAAGEPNLITSPFGLFDGKVRIQRNNFLHKSLSDWSCNIALGCLHGCRFCYVPETSANKQTTILGRHGIDDPDEQWGRYTLLRRWDESTFMASLKSGEKVAADKLSVDGNRAVMFCTTTDPYMVFTKEHSDNYQRMNAQRSFIMRRSLELIRDHSTLNVRILTRGGAAVKDFELFRSFGNRLMFGMSLPTLNENWLKVYEPYAPSASSRLKTLLAARAAGLHVYVAVAPTTPDCDRGDLDRTFQALKAVDPITIYHEPINIRANNVERIAAHAREIGQTVTLDVFENTTSWAAYALGQLRLVQKVAAEHGWSDRLHLWPDPDLRFDAKSKGARFSFGNFQRMLHGGGRDARQTKQADSVALVQHQAWIDGWWARVSEWPGTNRAIDWNVPALPEMPQGE